MKHKKRHRMNLFQRLSIGLITIVTAVAVLLTGSFCLYYGVRAEESVADSILQISESNAKDISNVFGRVEMCMESLSSSTSGVCEQLLVYEGDPQSCVKSFQQTRDLVGNYINVALSPITERYHVYYFVDHSFDLFHELPAIQIDIPQLDGRIWMYSDVEIQDEPWYQNAQEHPNESHWFLRDNSSTLYMARCMQYMTVSGMSVEDITLGVLLIKLDTAWLGEYVNISALTAGTQFLLLDEADRILYAADSALCGSQYSDIASTAAKRFEWNDQIYTQEITAVEPDMQLVTLIPSAERLQNVGQVYVLFGGILAMVLLIGSLFSVSLSHRIAGPILQLADHMRTNQMTHIQPVRSIPDDDVQILYESYNRLVDQVQESIRKKLEYAQREKELELNVLQAQINPHFLCNSLNSIFNLATLHGETEIANAASTLCIFLRYNISAPQIEIPLQRELDMLESYIALQNFLCGDKIVFEYDIQIDSEQIRIPKMLLQPLVENCILHGTHDGYVDITVTCRADDVYFTLIVADDGESDIDAINRHLEAQMTESDIRPHGFGIRNVNQRIQMKFGRPYGLHYERSDAGGTAACVNLPISLVEFSPNGPRPRGHEGGATAFSG